MKRTIILLLFICSGIVVGYFVSNLTASVSWLKWLSFGLSFGTSAPFSLNLGVLTISLGASFNLNLAIIIFTAIAGYLYYFFNHRSGGRRRR